MTQDIIDAFLASNHEYDDELSETENIIEWLLTFHDFCDAKIILKKLYIV